MLDYPCVKLASSIGRASGRKSEGRGFESHMRLTLNFNLKSKNLNRILNIIYNICIYIYIYIYIHIYTYICIKNVPSGLSLQVLRGIVANHGLGHMISGLYPSA